MSNKFIKNLPFAMFKNGRTTIYDKDGIEMFGLKKEVLLKTSTESLPKVTVEMFVNVVNDEAEMKLKAAKNKGENN